METMYQKLLGARFDILPKPIRAMHLGVRRATGLADIKRGTSLLAQLICRIARVPQSGEGVVVETAFTPIDNGERWTRSFNGEEFHTELRIANRGAEPELTESFGLLRFRLRMAVHEDGVDLIPEGVSMFGIGLPRFLCPGAVGLERVRDGKYRFDVSVRAPLAGELVSYSGWLEPVVEGKQ